MPTQYDIQQTQSGFHLCQSSFEKPRRSVELFHISFHMYICSKNLFQDRYFNKPLFQSAGFCLQIARIKLWSRARTSCTMILWAKFNMYSSHWDLNTGNICFQTTKIVYCYWNRKCHELSSIVPLVRFASSNLCLEMRNNSIKSCIFYFQNCVCCNQRHWRQ